MKNNGLLIPDQLQTKKFLDTFEEFRKMRKSTKNPLTHYAEQLGIDRVARLSENDPDVACEILNQSIFRNWAGLFSLNENKNGSMSMSMSEKVAKGLV